MDNQRYQRQLSLPDFGEQAQARLSKSKVLIVGAGGLGSPVAYYLACAGVGNIVLCDKDDVDLTNLNRQNLHFSNNIGDSKVASAKTKLKALNPSITIDGRKIDVNEANITSLAKGADMIADCLDNVDTRVVINDYAIKSGTPVLHAGINAWAGQLTLINPPSTPCYQCLFETYEETLGTKSVLGAVAGILGSMQALAIIKHLIGLDTGLQNYLMHFDATSMDWHKIKILKNKNCTSCGQKEV